MSTTNKTAQTSRANAPVKRQALRVRRSEALDQPDSASGPRARLNGKYEAILRAAIKVFASSGFFNSKVADVAREAGVADGTVYLYFKNKDDILVSIFNHVMDEALERGKQQLKAVRDPIEKLKRIVYAHLDRLGSDRDLAIVFQVELRSSTKFMEQFSATKVTEYLELIRQVIQEGQQRGVFRKNLNTTIASKVLFGALDEMATNWVLSRKRYNLVSTADVVFDLVLNGVASK
ncbi:MAG TPA: TetR/AcrR family transcriptional regulator [Blastocatellia bacterium]|nr:TetR/AcrR family transcriptional regulator [Blastocatellia bacterium]